MFQDRLSSLSFTQRKRTGIEGCLYWRSNISDQIRWLHVVRYVMIHGVCWYNWAIIILILQKCHRVYHSMMSISMQHTHRTNIDHTESDSTRWRWKCISIWRVHWYAAGVRLRKICMNCCHYYFFTGKVIKVITYMTSCMWMCWSATYHIWPLSTHKQWVLSSFFPSTTQWTIMMGDEWWRCVSVSNCHLKLKCAHYIILVLTCVLAWRHGCRLQ